jgi:ribonuclease T2
VVHGLWPQYNRGYPQSCSTQAKPKQEVIDGVIDIVPSETLIQHEWAKHGTCDGSDATGYFAKVRSAYSSIKIPDSFDAPTSARQTSVAGIPQDFLKSNPDVGAKGLAVVCDGRFLEEVHICLDRGLHPRNCGNDVKDKCSGGSVTVRPVG